MDELTDRRDLPIFIHSELDDHGLTSKAFRVYAHLARRAGKGGAFPSYASIGKVCFAPDMPDAKPETWRRLAIQAVKELVEGGLIRKEVRKDDEGNHTSNRYALTPRSMWGGSAYALGSDAPSLGGSDNALGSAYAPKGTPLEDAPLEGTPIKNDDRPKQKTDERDGRMLLALIQGRGFMYLDSQASLLAVKLEDEYTDAQLRTALDAMTTRHQTLIKEGKRGITSPLAYLRSVLAGMDDTPTTEKQPTRPGVDAYGQDWEAENRRFEEKYLKEHGHPFTPIDDDVEITF